MADLVALFIPEITQPEPAANFDKDDEPLLVELDESDEEQENEEEEEEEEIELELASR